MTNTSGRKFEEKYERTESGDDIYESEWLGRTENGGIHMNIWGEVGDRMVGNGHVIWDTSPGHISSRVQKFDDLKNRFGNLRLMKRTPSQFEPDATDYNPN